MLITHNLGIVARYADRVNVMYAGRIVESAGADALYAEPRHPYTIGLLRSVPRLDQPTADKLVPIEGQPPDALDMPKRLRLPSALPLRHRTLQRRGADASRRSATAMRVACWVDVRG